MRLLTFNLGRKGWRHIFADAVKEDVYLERECHFELVQFGPTPSRVLEPGKVAQSDLLVIFVKRQGFCCAQDVDALVHLAHSMECLHHHANEPWLGLPSLAAKYFLDHTVASAQTVIRHATPEAILAQGVVDRA